MEAPVETVTLMKPGSTPALEILLLGPVEVRRDGISLALARSRKLRALLAILVTEARPLSRRRLCDLLWDRPNDPRAELRWHLSKLRQIVDAPDRQRLIADEDEISLDLDGCVVDALQVMEIEQNHPPAADRLNELSKLFRGQFLGELTLSGPLAEQWLTAQRRKYTACQISIIKALVARLPKRSDEVAPHLELWLDLAPFDLEAHRHLLGHLAGHGRIAEAGLHLATTERLFMDEGIPAVELRQIWSTIKAERVRTSSATDPSPALGMDRTTNETSPPAMTRAALAMMPFTVRDSKIGKGIADGLTHDVITRLAKLRSLSIIARGSVYALAALGIPDTEAGRRLKVDYVASGSLHRVGPILRLDIELTETRSERIVWAETCDVPADDMLEALDALGNRIVAALTGEIEQAERNRAILRAPSSLDAWGAHHRGLWHMYRFTKENNARAQHFFDLAVTLDPTFSRAHAGLSFTHWQNAFQNWSDPGREAELAYVAAAQSLLADEQDPAAHWAMGRALWLRKQHGQAVAELRESVNLSPNFALGHYSLAFVESQTGDPTEAIKASDRSRMLSPYDPLMFGMLGSRAIAHLRLGQFEEAADWATQAAARPNAHINILGIAALCLALADRAPEGLVLAASIHATQPRYGIDDFLSAFHFSPSKATLLRAAAAQVALA